MLSITTPCTCMSVSFTVDEVLSQPCLRRLHDRQLLPMSLLLEPIRLFCYFAVAGVHALRKLFRRLRRSGRKFTWQAKQANGASVSRVILRMASAFVLHRSRHSFIEVLKAGYSIATCGVSLKIFREQGYALPMAKSTHSYNTQENASYVRCPKPAPGHPGGLFHSRGHCAASCKQPHVLHLPH